ncbi:5'-3' DNA helicase ZGRF1 [Mantella aurantiaca]
MAAQEFTVLYTHQKTKKSKVWQDGVLKIPSGGNQASLFNDKGQRLDNVFMKTGKLNIGDDLESERYLITVEAEGASSNTSESNNERKDIPAYNRYGLKSAGLRPPAGVKRKFTSFQCPREVTKKPCPEVESVRTSSDQEKGCTSLTSPLFSTSPLFAASFTKKADTGGAAQWQSGYQPEDSSYSCEKQSNVTCGNLQVNGNASSSHFPSIKNQVAERANVHHINGIEDGNRTKQSIRSTAQILALLRTQPSKEGTLTKLADQNIDPEPVKPDNDHLGCAFSDSASSPLLQCEDICQEPSQVKPHPVKSRWDVYLHQPVSSSIDYGDNNDAFVPSGNSNDRLKINNPFNCFLNNGKKQDMNGENTWTLEVEKTHMTDHKLNDLGHIGRLSNKQLYNSDMYSENNSCESGLSYIESPTPVLCSHPSNNPAKLQVDEVDLANVTYAEVSFNMLDSFDFTELDDGDSNVAPSHSQNRLLSAEEHMAMDEENNTTLFKPDSVKPLLGENFKKEVNSTTCIPPIPTNFFGRTAESKLGELTVSSDLTESNVCDQHKDEVRRGEKLSTLCESRSMLFPFTDKEGDIPCGQSALKSEGALQQEGLPSDSDARFKGTSDSFVAQNFLEEVQCSEEDSPGSPQSGSSISVLKTLIKPCSAIESLNALKLKSCSTPEKRDCESGTSLKNGTQEDLYCTPQGHHRTNHLAINLPVCEDVPSVPSFTTPALSTFSPVCDNEDASALCYTKSTSPPLTPFVYDEEQPTSAMDSSLGPLDEGCFDYSVPSQTALLHTMTPHESNFFSSVPCSPPRWTLATQGSDCDWEFSQWTESKVKTPTKEKPDSLKRQFFLRPRQCVSVESPQAFTQQHSIEEVCVENRSACGIPYVDLLFLSITMSYFYLECICKAAVTRKWRYENEAYFMNPENLFKVQMRIPIITQPETVNASLNPMNDGLNGGFHAPENQTQNSFLSRTSSYRSKDKHSIITDDKGQGGEDDLYYCLGTGPTLLGQPNHLHEPVSQQPSKWLKYQDASSENSQHVNDEENTEFCAQSVFRHPERIEIQNDETELAQEPQPGLLKPRLHSQIAPASRVELITNVLTPANGSIPRMTRKNLYFHDTGDKQISLSCDLAFPPKHIVLSASVPKRKVNIPAEFLSSAHYKQVFIASLAEHLNVIMFELSQRLHKAFSKVDISFYTSSDVDETNRKDKTSPLCLHQQPAKLVMVRKEGPNKGRFFYTCDAPKADQCKYFKWLDEVKGTKQEKGKLESRLVIGDMKNLSKYIRCQNIKLYEESQLIIRKISGYPKRQFGKFVKVVNTDAALDHGSKTKLYLKLNRKDNSSAYSKDDVWVVSKTLNFDPMDTFIACSVFFGPTANNDIEISPLKGYCPSNWPANMIVHALLVCNASTELTCMRNIQEHFNSSTLPLMPHLLTMPSECAKPNKITRGKFKPPSITAKTSNKCEISDYNFVMNLAKDMVIQFCLNEDQAAALMQIALMMCGSDGPEKQQNPPITIIHGVFGAGKSYLLAVVVLFLVQLFESFDSSEEWGASHWKLLISSSTNVAVDRVLLGLLDLRFDQFIRVGSIRKIAKPILPHSLHAGSENESEQLKELLALLKEDLTPGEKVYVRKSIVQHKLGTNKTLLGQVRVVGATCAACPFACMSNLKFPVVVLDECSQMTEPASLLPIARFQCEKLILVGDPKQLSPTIQGSEAAHEAGLEQTLFDRLSLMGHQTVILKTQYRCHPVISAVANDLFYGGFLLNGVSQEDRKPLLDWLPTLCFYNANGTEQVEGNNSFYNIEEANFTVKLIQSLIASGIQSSMIGVITLYKSQMAKICSLPSGMSYCDPMEMKAVQVSTVDAFQGAEKEIIILSCVRTRQVGFLDSEKRMNVALTRGKRHLLIVGNLPCLRKNKMWEQVIHHCERQNNGLRHVSQWDEKLSCVLKLYQEKKEQELKNMQAKHSKGKAGPLNVKAPLPT